MTEAGELLEGVLTGRRRSIAKALSVVEDGGAEAHALLAALYPRQSHAQAEEGNKESQVYVAAPNAHYLQKVRHLSSAHQR